MVFPLVYSIFCMESFDVQKFCFWGKTRCKTVRWTFEKAIVTMEMSDLDILVRSNSCVWKNVLHDECLKLYLKEKCSRNILQIWGYMTILEHCHGRKVLSLWVKEIIASIKRRKKAVQFQWVIIIISHAPWILHVLCVCV